MVRAVRERRGWRQVDLAERVGVSRETISRVERGELGRASVDLLRLVSKALDLPPIVTLGWRGAEVAALLDARHAALVERVVGRLRAHHWEALVEYSFSHYGERGSVDVVAWRPSAAALLLVEAKTRIVDLQDLFATLDRKRRVVPRLLADERGWRSATLGIALVVPATPGIRAAIARHGQTFEAMLPSRTVQVRRWVAQSAGDMRGIWFVNDSQGT